MQKRFSEEQVIGFLREAEAGGVHECQRAARGSSDSAHTGVVDQ